MKYRLLTLIFVLSFTSAAVSAQRSEVTISLNETFFDSLLDAVFQNSGPIEFAIASAGPDRKGAETLGNVYRDSPASGPLRRANAFSSSASSRFGSETEPCKEVIQLLRENNGVRTAVRFREGKILAPLAFTGAYNPPLVGCVPFSGYAETVIDLEFDQPNQRLIARARVLNVSLNGTGGVGGTLIAKMVQSSIDKKINPIEVLTLEKLSFILPVRKDTNLRMKAVAVRTEIVNGSLGVVVAYDFLK